MTPIHRDGKCPSGNTRPHMHIADIRATITLACMTANFSAAWILSVVADPRIPKVNKESLIRKIVELSYEVSMISDPDTTEKLADTKEEYVAKAVETYWENGKHLEIIYDS